MQIRDSQSHHMVRKQREQKYAEARANGYYVPPHQTDAEQQRFVESYNKMVLSHNFKPAQFLLI
jgi:hypothetical protein